MEVNESLVSTAPGECTSVLILIPLREAAKSLGIQATTLRKYVSRHRKAFPPIYRVEQGCKRRVRYLTEDELILIRQISKKPKLETQGDTPGR